MGGRIFSTLSNNSSHTMARSAMKPKRPMTGYMRFANEIRPEIEEETGLTGIHTAKPISQRWNAMSDDEKEVYNAQFRDEMVCFKEKMAAYKKTPAFAAEKAAKKAKKLGKKPKDPNAPKRPMSGYFLFGNSVREEVQEELGTTDFKKVSARINAMWQEADQESFNAKSAKAREQYKKTVAKYQKTKQYAEYQQRVADWKKSATEAKKAA